MAIPMKTRLQSSQGEIQNDDDNTVIFKSSERRNSGLHAETDDIFYPEGGGVVSIENTRNGLLLPWLCKNADE